MQERHVDRKRYFNEQIYTTQKYIIPFINKVMEISNETDVLEIGCGEGGNLKPFLDLGCNVTGVDLSHGKIEKGKNFFKDDPNKEKIKLITEDIYQSASLGKYDLIIMRDVIEHIHNQEKFMEYVKKFLNPHGKIFLAFPPWYNPFGGHQQVCENKLLSKLPFFHILPAPIYKGILKLFGESNPKIDSLLEIKSTGITIERFEKILKQSRYKTEKKKLFFINPNYEVKFGLKPKDGIPLLSSIPLIKDFVTTSAYYIISFSE